MEADCCSERAHRRSSIEYDDRRWRLFVNVSRHYFLRVKGDPQEHEVVWPRGRGDQILERVQFDRHLLDRYLLWTFVSSYDSH